MVLRRVTDKSLVLATRLASQGVRVASSMVLLRLVSQEDYGRFDLLMAVPGLLAAAGDFGITRSVTASHDLPEDRVQDTALTLLLGIAIVNGMLALAGGWYYDVARADSRLRWIGLIVAATFVVQNVQSAQMALLARELRFARWAGVEALMMIATVATGIGVAIAGGGIFALALQQLLAAVCGLAVTVHGKPLRWPQKVDRAIARRFFSYGWKVSLYQWTNNAPNSIGRLTIGRFAGDLAVGVFGRASQVRELIGHGLVTTFDLVLMPLFARAKDDVGRLRDLLIRGSVGVTVYCSFGAAWLAAVAPDLIRVVAGPRWADVPSVLRALAPGLAIQAMCYPCIIMSLALNQPLVSFRYALLNLVGLAVSIVALWQWGVWHFAAAQSAYAIIPTVYAARWGAHVTGFRFRILFMRLVPILLEALVVCATMLASASALKSLEDTWLANVIAPHWKLVIALLRLALVSLIGALTGWALLAGWDRRNYADLKSLLLRRKEDPEITATDLAVEP